MRESLVEIGRRICANADAGAKPLEIYAIYDRYFGDFSDRAVTLLELGVHTGESLKVWASYFPLGTIIGVDIGKNRADFSGYPNIVFERGDQTDPERLKQICLAHAADGLDIIVDDASHIGHNSAASYATLFPYLKPGGLYIVEDWGTGYFDDWPDGGHFQRFHSEAVDGQIAKRIPSHDFGMVGFVKSLVDEVAGDNVKPMLRAAPTRPNIMSFIHLYKESVIIGKSSVRADAQIINGSTRSLAVNMSSNLTKQSARVRRFLRDPFLITLIALIVAGSTLGGFFIGRHITRDEFIRKVSTRSAVESASLATAGNTSLNLFQVLGKRSDDPLTAQALAKLYNLPIGDRISGVTSADQL